VTEVITSTANARVKRVRNLQSERGDRESDGLFVVEGLRLVREALEGRASIEVAFFTEPFSHDRSGADLLHALSEQNVETQAVTDEVMRSMAVTQTPQGVVAVVEWVRLAAPDRPSFVLIADSIHDPGNIGTIMRLAAGAAVPLMLLMPGTVDIYNPKVVRSAMGAHFRIPVVAATWGEASHWLASQRVYLADSRQGTAHFEVDWVQPCALIISDEAHGASPDAARLAQMRVTIPMPGQTESLNVAMAAGIILYEMVRQRMQAQPRGEDGQ
jgi:TrmH family RNA methyltransferase